MLGRFLGTKWLTKKWNEAQDWNQKRKEFKSLKRDLRGFIQGKSAEQHSVESLSDFTNSDFFTDKERDKLIKLAVEKGSLDAFKKLFPLIKNNPNHIFYEDYDSGFDQPSQTYRYSLISHAIDCAREDIAVFLASHPDFKLGGGTQITSHLGFGQYTSSTAGPLDKARLYKMDNLVSVLERKAREPGVSKSVSSRYSGPKS